MWNSKITNNLIKKLKGYQIDDIENTILCYFYEENKIKKNPYRELNNKDIEKIIASNITSFSTEDIIHFFELLIPEEEKQLNGAFFTPDFIVEKIISELEINDTDLIIDPSCGCGAFLFGVANHLHRKGKNFSSIFKENLYGIDLSEKSSERAKKLLTLLANLNGEFGDFKFNIFQGDSLDIGNIVKDKKFDIVIGNPPYVKYQDLPDSSRELLGSKNWKSISSGAFNLYFAFFELGYDLLKQDGKLGYITPNNYFTSLAGESLRTYFKERKCINRIIDFKHHKVFDALTYTAITILTKQENDYILYDHIKENLSVEEYLKNVSYSKVPIIGLNNKKRRLLKEDEMLYINKIESQPYRLGGVMKIKNGIATCKDEVYMINGKKGNKYIKIYEGNEYEIEKDILRKVYKISDLDPKNKVANQGTWIIFPYIRKGDSYIPMSEDVLKKKYPKTYKYLCLRKHDLASRDKGKIEYTPWYSYARSQGLNNFGSKLLSPTFSGTPRYMYDSDDESFFVNGYGLYLNLDVGYFIPNLSLLAISKILNSGIMDYYIKNTSVGIDGGCYCYQKNFVELFGLPDFSEEEKMYLENEDNIENINKFLIKKYDLSEEILNYI